MVESLEMIIKFSNDIVSEEGLEIPARLTWMVCWVMTQWKIMKKTSLV